MSDETTKNRFYNANEISGILDVSKTSAYRIIKLLNDELKADGYIIVPGKISRKYFDKKVML